MKTALSDDFVRGGVIVRPDFQQTHVILLLLLAIMSLNPW